MRKGILECCILSIIGDGNSYASDIIQKLKAANLIVVEGTLYPLLTRLKNDAILNYIWVESNQGPPRKYYNLSPSGKRLLNNLLQEWNSLIYSVELCTNTNKNKS